MFRILLLSLLTVTLLFSLENKTGTNGYVRLQTSLQNGKENVCFQAPGASSKYRLGNECDTWLDLGIYQDITFENGLVLHNQIRPVYLGANEENVEFLQFDELYSELFNLFDNKASFWIGRRYLRYDSHISDYFYFNMSGDGLGVNNLDLGGLTLSYNLIFNAIHPDSVAGDETVLFQSHDIRLAKATKSGEFTLFLNYMSIDSQRFTSTQKIDKVDGYALGLFYKENKFFQNFFSMKGESVNGLFYGEGAAKGAGSSSPFHQKAVIETMLSTGKNMGNSQTWRFINYNAFESETLGIMSNFVYEHRDDFVFSNTKQEWLSFGLRPYWFMTKKSRLLFEAGYDHVDDKVKKTTYALEKATIVLEMAMDKGLWERPVLRLYYTQAAWSQSAKGLIGTGYYKEQTDGNNLGIQMEYWW